MGERLEGAVLQALAGLIDELDVVVIFGSRAGARPRSSSDLDVAVLPAPGASRDRLPARVAAALSDVVPHTRVDVVLVDEAPVLLRQRIMERGRLVLGGASPQWRELRVRTMREHADREALRDMLLTAQRKRLTERRPSGRQGRALRSLERVGGLSRRAPTVR